MYITGHGTNVETRIEFRRHAAWLRDSRPSIFIHKRTIILVDVNKTSWTTWDFNQCEFHIQSITSALHFLYTPNFFLASGFNIISFSNASMSCLLGLYRCFISTQSNHFCGAYLELSMLLSCSNFL